MTIVYYLYHGVWVDQRVLPWYNYKLLQYHSVAGNYTMASSYTIVARGVNAR